MDAVLIMVGLVEFAVNRALRNASPPLPLSAVLKVEESDQTKRARETLNRSEMHIHAEERETSLIMKWFPELLKKEEEIKNLKPVMPPLEVFFELERGGKWREISPLGYIGNPSVAAKENADLYFYESVDIAEAIVNFLKKSEP